LELPVAEGKSQVQIYTSHDAVNPKDPFFLFEGSADAKTQSGMVALKKQKISLKFARVDEKSECNYQVYVFLNDDPYQIITLKAKYLDKSTGKLKKAETLYPAPPPPQDMNSGHEIVDIEN